MKNFLLIFLLMYAGSAVKPAVPQSWVVLDIGSPVMGSDRKSSTLPYRENKNNTVSSAALFPPAQVQEVCTEGKVADLPPLRGKETYVWASFFNSRSNAHLIQLLTRWRISNLFLSVNSTTDAAKLKEFQKMAARLNIGLHYLIGENSYVTSDHGFEDLLVLLTEAESLGFKGIHLDIEPHTFDDYEEETELYVKRQIALFEKAAEWSSLRNIKLSASVPLHLPAEVAASLYRHRVTAYIMAYDYLSLETKIRKTQQIRSILKNRYRWVFHLEDFSGIKDLAAAEKTLRKHQIKAFSYYDLSQMENFGR